MALRMLALSLIAVTALPIMMSAAAVFGGERNHWSRARWDSAGIAPDPRATPEAIVQVYAARTYGWRGILAVHPWIAVKRKDADHWSRFDVTGWAIRRGGSTSVRSGDGVPDGYWAGNPPELLLDLRGAGVEGVIDKIERAVASYPDSASYIMWPGPNSNSFVAHVAREVPELRLALPPTAIGKDYIAGGGLVARAPSGTGWTFSLFGLAGMTVAADEGLEFNLLGLTVGVDPLMPAIKLPGIGRIGVPRETQRTVN
jgi:hypothetical protein